MSEKDGFPILPPNLLLAENYIDCWKCTHLLQLFSEIIDFFKKSLLKVRRREGLGLTSGLRSRPCPGPEHQYPDIFLALHQTPSPQRTRKPYQDFADQKEN